MSDYRDCKKCGANTNQRPIYTQDDGWEYLKRVCGNCGYVTKHATADSVEATAQRARQLPPSDHQPRIA